MFKLPLRPRVHTQHLLRGAARLFYTNYLSDLESHVQRRRGAKNRSATAVGFMTKSSMTSPQSATPTFRLMSLCRANGKVTFNVTAVSPLNHPSSLTMLSGGEVLMTLEIYNA